MGLTHVMGLGATPIGLPDRVTEPLAPKRLITTWITDGVRDTYADRHRELFGRCLASWVRHMPDWEVVVVTAANAFAYDHDAVAEQWLRDGHFIGVSQWARLSWLLRFGGIYVDSDVEAVASFEPLRQYGFAVGHEGGDSFANNAVMAARHYHPFVEEQLRDVVRHDPRHQQFGNETGPRMLTRLLRAHGWDGRDEDSSVPVLPDRDARAWVLRSDVLYPTFYRPSASSRGVTDRTLAIHHWGASWVRESV